MFWFGFRKNDDGELTRLEILANINKIFGCIIYYVVISFVPAVLDTYSTFVSTKNMGPVFHQNRSHARSISSNNVLSIGSGNTWECHGLRYNHSGFRQQRTVIHTNFWNFAGTYLFQAGTGRSPISQRILVDPGIYCIFSDLISKEARM